MSLNHFSKLQTCSPPGVFLQVTWFFPASWPKIKTMNIFRRVWPLPLPYSARFSHVTALDNNSHQIWVVIQSSFAIRYTDVRLWLTQGELERRPRQAETKTSSTRGNWQVWRPIYTTLNFLNRTDETRTRTSLIRAGIVLGLCTGRPETCRSSGCFYLAGAGM